MLHPSRLLNVENEEILAENRKILLGRHRSEVRIVEAAISAMDSLKSCTADPMILDYARSEIDGLRDYSSIDGDCIKTPRCIPIIDNPPKSITDGGHRVGIRHILSKPFSLTELHHTVDLMGSNVRVSVCFVRQKNDRQNYRIPRFQTDRPYQWGRRELQHRQFQVFTPQLNDSSRC